MSNPRRTLLVLAVGVTLNAGGLAMSEPASSSQPRRHTNRLVRESSPYLLQHAHNPVDWYPWGPEAFEAARQSGKPIFLSVGYSTCYWCHVMERQCFENEAIAKLMNELFINIKVDREERPDVDDIYMTATQMMTGQGGWPMSVFLTPPGAAGPEDRGLKPIWAGTYLPPEPGFGRPSFPQVMQAIAAAWRDKKQEILQHADEVAQGVTQAVSRREQPADVGVQTIASAGKQLLRTYDPEHGGFGNAPKFPQPCNLQFLLRVQRNNPNPDLLLAVRHTLDRMARGGMYDQIGGGFHRYSTDERWLVPHFEKMLYDNAQLVQTYITAMDVAPLEDDPGLYERVVRQTCDYVLREMTDATGAFWSAQDAEVDTKEGGNYVWQPAEIDQALADPNLAALARKMYGLSLGPNFQDPHHRELPPTYVLYLPRPLPALAGDEYIKVDQLLQRKAEIDAKLLAARSLRKQPGTDDKSLAAWNGMMIAALAQAGQKLSEPRYTAAAEKAADAVLQRMRAADGSLLRAMRGGQAKIPAFLEDYAFVAQGLLALHRSTGKAHWPAEARRLLDLAQARFAVAADAGGAAAVGASGGGGYYDTLADQNDLFVRTRSAYDGAIPSGNSQMIHSLLDLYDITRDPAVLARAGRDLRAHGSALERAGAGMAHMQHALLRYLEALAAAGQTPAQAAQDAPALKPAPAIKPASAATTPAVTVQAAPGKVSLASGAAVIDVTLAIAPGYHVNSHDPGVKGLIAAVLKLEQADGVALTVQYPPAVQRKFAFGDEAVQVWEGQAALRATLTKTATGPLRRRPVLLLKYQACSDTQCLQPAEVEVPVLIE